MAAIDESFANCLSAVRAANLTAMSDRPRNPGIVTQIVCARALPPKTGLQSSSTVRRDRCANDDQEYFAKET
ncbi:hypothetical protein ACVILK_002224 [Bradyrhizobium embrapense]